MSAETPDLNALAARIETLAERLADVEVQARALVTSEKVEARDFVLKDERARIRARLEIQEYSPRLTFYDTPGQECLRIGLRADGSPSFQVEGQKIRLHEGEGRTT